MVRAGTPPVPHQRERNSGAVVHEFLEAAADRHGARTFVRAGDRSWTFSDLDEWSNAWARHLESSGVTSGDRVALMTTNRVEFPVVVNALSKLGAAAVLISPAWRSAEVGHAVSLTTPVCGVADGDSVTTLGSHLRVIDLDVVDPRRGDNGLVHAEVVSETAEVILVFSSGTTGLPKAVRHTHRSIRYAVQHWISSLGLGDQDRLQVATPPTHILGLLNLLAATATGAEVRLHSRFDLDEWLRRIESDRVTIEMAVAPIALAMSNHPRLESYDLSSLRYIVWGATPVTPSVAEGVTARTGVRWLPGYGASEVPVIAMNPEREPDRWRLDSAGLPPPGIELRVVDIDTEAVLAAGESGEIQVKSPSVMAGYLPDSANADAFVGDWYRTGDIGWLEDEGWVHLTDRAKEMIKVKAFQVAPAEIEQVLLGHPGVLDCAVFGVPDTMAGELPVAAVQLDPAVPVDEAELCRLVADSLATYKNLKEVVVVDIIPRSPSGKALRRVLRHQWDSGLGARTAHLGTVD